MVLTVVISDMIMIVYFYFQEGEISADLLTFHEAVSQLQMLEDDVLDTHKSVMEATAQWHARDGQLLSATHEVDYDQDGEASVIVNIVKHLIAFTALPVMYIIFFMWITQNKTYMSKNGVHGNNEL